MKKEILSECETPIMKAVWDAEGDISISDLMEVLRVQFDKDYKRTTVVTFLLRLSDKGFVSTYRVGKYAYVHAERTEDEYKAKLAKREADFWFQGSACGFVAALNQENPLSEEERNQIRSLLDGMGD